MKQYGTDDAQELGTEDHLMQDMTDIIVTLLGNPTNVSTNVGISLLF